MMARVVACACAMGVLATASAASAEDRPKTKAHEYSAYEKESIRDALAASHTIVDPSPEGKIVEDIDIVTLDVIEKRDPAPGFLNVFHAKTRPYVIRREVLIRPGEPFSQSLCDESARNLRQFHQLSLVACLAERGSRPDRVRILVLAKDVWSLRLNWDVQFAGGRIEYLELVPSEENLLGSHQTASGLFTLYPLSYSLGGRYIIPRMFGTWVAATASASAIVNRESGHTEGSYGGVNVGQPLYSTRTEWAWGTPVTWRNEVTRHYVNGALGYFDSRRTPANDRIPFEYRTRTMSIGPSVTRSFGWALKNDISFGVDVIRRQFDTFDMSAYDPIAVDHFVSRYVPLSDNRSGPFLQYRTYRTDYVRVLDFETLALQEDFRLGHDLYARVYPSPKAFGSTRNVLGAYGGAQYTWALGDGITRIGLESTAAYEFADRPEGREAVTDAAVEATGRIVTPRLGFGRLVVDALVRNRYRNYLNQITFLGGEGRLRGYPTRSFYGKDQVSYNFEYRSRPVQILSCQLGATLFYDVGDSFDGFTNMVLKSSVGAGLRALFPQLDRAVFRVDLGFPVTRGYIPQGFPGQVYVSFHQAFAMPAISGR
ncbi:MAG: hypothetical protein HY898_00710 [Deltaproteobacteria bacterium]|nr:hypothetical protein [Deltaproteobacteria bacterium]